MGSKGLEVYSDCRYLCSSRIRREMRNSPLKIEITILPQLETINPTPNSRSNRFRAKPQDTIFNDSLNVKIKVEIPVPDPRSAHRLDKATACYPDHPTTPSRLHPPSTTKHLSAPNHHPSTCPQHNVRLLSPPQIRTIPAP